MAEQSKVVWYSAIRAKLIIIIIVTTTVVLGAAGLFAYKYTEVTQRAGLTELARVTADRLSAHLVIPMWDVDFTQVEKLLEAEMLEARIAGIVVRDEDGKSLFAAKERGPGGTVVDSNGALSGDLIEQSRDVQRDDEKIGAVSVFLTSAYLNSELRQFAWGVGAIMVGLDFIIFLIMTVAMGRMVINPLKRLSVMAEQMSRGDLKQSITVDSRDEIGNLATALDRMRISLSVIIRRLAKSKGG